MELGLRDIHDLGVCDEDLMPDRDVPLVDLTRTFRLDWEAATDDYCNSKSWHLEPASEKQVTYMKRLGWHPPEPCSKGLAAHVLSKSRPCTVRQKAFLIKRRLWEPAMSLEEASRIISGLAEREKWGERRRA